MCAELKTKLPLTNVKLTLLKSFYKCLQDVWSKYVLSMTTNYDIVLIKVVKSTFFHVAFYQLWMVTPLSNRPSWD